MHYTTSGLMAGIFGIRASMDNLKPEARQKGGRARSHAKVAVSGRDGARGGRPKKT
jgi:hypothetical protein